MTQHELHRAVARVTGEDLSTIASMGFQPLRRRPFEADPESYTTDWDELEQERNVPLYPPRHRSHAAA